MKTSCSPGDPPNDLQNVKNRPAPPTTDEAPVFADRDPLHGGEKEVRERWRRTPMTQKAGITNTTTEVCSGIPDVEVGWWG